VIASLERSIDATSASSTHALVINQCIIPRGAPTPFDARAFICRRATRRRTNATTRAMVEDDDWRARIDRTAAVQELCVRDATTRMDGSIMNLFDG